MKKLIISFTFVFLALPIFGESKDSFNHYDQWRPAFFTGLNGSGVYGKYLQNEIFKFGFNGGISVIKKIQDNLHFRSGFYYINKGYKTRQQKSEDYIDRKERTYLISHNFEIPLMLQFYAPLFDYSTNWYGGFGFSYALSQQITTKVDGKIVEDTPQNDYRSMDFPLIIGSNIMANRHINFDIRMSCGLIPISEKSDFFGMRNISILFSIGYFL